MVLAIGYFVVGKKTTSKYESEIVTDTSQDSPQVPINYEEDNLDKTVQISDAYEIKNVPFQSQAPDANWDELHDEACEEASIIIAQYFDKNKSLSKEEMESEIQKMVSWQIANWGSHKDLTAAETQELAKNIYGLNLTEKNITSLNDIKQEISENHLVIVPAAGRLLGNPNFRIPGPVYHMLVISGYNKNQFITQEVGTRNGKNYAYNETILFNAIHDWTGNGDSINNGLKNILVMDL